VEMGLRLRLGLCAVSRHIYRRIGQHLNLIEPRTLHQPLAGADNPSTLILSLSKGEGGRCVGLQLTGMPATHERWR
jgi:hypothetical protein